jgi:hypothetical protein
LSVGKAGSAKTSGLLSSLERGLMQTTRRSAFGVKVGVTVGVTFDGTFGVTLFSAILTSSFDRNFENLELMD